METKKLILVFLGIIVTIAAFSQDKTGIKGGVNFTNLYVEDVDDENMKVGFNAGIYHRMELSDHLAIQPEFLFSQKGASLHYDDNIFTGGSGNYRFNLNYLEVPALLVLKSGNFNIHAGPYAGFLVGVNIKDVDEDGNISEIESLDRDDFNTFDYGVAAGVGFDFTGGMLGFRYNYGFNEIGESGTFAGQATEDSKNSAFQIYLGFDF